MSITDELREWWVRMFPAIDRGVHRDFGAIADRIDAEHERLMQEQPYTIDMVPMTDEHMAEHGWIRLPKDADGVPIRVGDVLDECAVNTYVFLPAKVVGYHECCGEIMPIVENDGEFQVKPDCVCHYHEPTVEDVLREFAYGLGVPVADSYVAATATKLRLAGDAE